RVGAGRGRRGGDGRQQGGVQVGGVGVAADDGRVPERVPEARPPGRLGVLQVHERSGRSERDRGDGDEAPQDDERLSTTPATYASRSESEPSLTYEKSARRNFSSSEMRRASRSAKRPRRCSRSTRGAV